MTPDELAELKRLAQQAFDFSGLDPEDTLKEMNRND